MKYQDCELIRLWNLETSVERSKKAYQEPQGVASSQVPAPGPEVCEGRGQVGLVEVRRNPHPNQ